MKQFATVLMLAVSLSLSAAVLCGSVYAQGAIYWGDLGATFGGTDGSINQANLDGSASGSVFSDVPDPYGVALGLVFQQIYWADVSAGTIQRGDPNGTNNETIVSGLSNPTGLELDEAGGQVYWVNAGSGSIQRCNVPASGSTCSGAAIETLVSGLTQPLGLALDLTNDRMYWSDFGSNKIQRCDLADCSTTVIDLVSSLDGPGDIALEIASDRLYWVEAGGADKVRRCTISTCSTTTTDLVTMLNNPQGIALDLSNDKVYWTDNAPSIGRADLNGSNPETIITSGLVAPREIAIDPSGVLPVELVAFDAVVDGTGVVLTWETASETNNAGFEVQRLSGREGPAASAWETLVFVDGYGTTEQPRQYSQRFSGLAPDTYRFRLKQVDYDGTFEYSPELEVRVAVQSAYQLSSAFPNPFHTQTQFTLAVAQPQQVRVEVFDVLGRRVALLHEGLLEARENSFTFTTTHLPEGVYIYRALGEHFVDSRQLVLVK